MDLQNHTIEQLNEKLDYIKSRYSEFVAEVEELKAQEEMILQKLDEIYQKEREESLRSSLS